MPIPFITSQGLAVALNLGQSKLKQYIQKKIGLQILKKVELRIESEINKFIENLQKRTRIYLLIALLNVFCLIVSIYFTEYKFLNSIALIVSIGFILYMAYNSIVNFKQSINYFQHFEQHIKSLLTNELEKAKDNDWKNKVALLIDSKEVHDYYLIVLDKIVSSTSSWLTQNKSLLYVRISLFILASASLTYSARELL